MNSSYEIYSQGTHDRQWRLESVLDGKASAVDEARRLLDRSGILRVQVIEERVAADGALQSSGVVFKATATPTRRPPSERTRPQRTKATETARPQPAEKEGDFFRYITLMILSLSGIGLALVGGILVLLP